MFLINQFLLINGHFTLYLLTALVCFSVAWLYYDAWLGTHDSREGTKTLGFLFLSLAYVIASTTIEQSLLETSLIGRQTGETLYIILKVLGYLILIVGQLIVPLQPLPEYRLIKKKESAAMLLGIPLIEYPIFIFPLLAVYTAFLYLRRATLGLEHHLRQISYSFFALTVAEILATASTFRITDNIFVENLVKPYGPIWILQDLAVFAFMVILGSWVWGYLIRRLETQLFIIFTSLTLVIFLVTTIFFTSTSINNLKNGSLENLEINVNVLSYSIETKKQEVLSDAQVVAQNSQIIAAINDNDKTSLATISEEILLAKKQTNLIIVDKNGGVLMRGEDVEKIGGSLSDDPLVKKALLGENVSGITTTEGALAPIVNVQASVPIKSGNEIIGAVLAGTSIDNAFLDGLKKATGLEASIYAGNVRSATTFVAPDGKSRWAGIKEETEEIKKKVLIDGEKYLGGVKVLNIPYYAGYSPLWDVSGGKIGMLFVGLPQASLLKAASSSIELTFLVTVGLLVVSLIPAFFISKYLINQLR